MAFNKKFSKPKSQRLSPMGRLGFGKDRLRNVLGVDKNPKTAGSFMNAYKSKATNYY